MNNTNKTLLIIEREFMVRVKKKSFIVMTLLVPVLLAGAAMMPVLLSMIKSDKEKRIAVLDESGQIAARLHDAGSIKFALANEPLDSLKKTITESGNFALLHIARNATDSSIASITMYSAAPAGVELMEAVESQIKHIAARTKLEAYGIAEQKIDDILNTSVHIASFVLDGQGEEKQSDSRVMMALSMVGGVLIFIIIFMFGMQIMRGVIEEKSSRIIEIIISSIKPMQLMMGKIVGVALVVLLQLVIWAALFALIMAVFGAVMAMGSGNAADSGVLGVLDIAGGGMQAAPLRMMAVCFVLYLILGYLLYASLFAIVGAAVDNETDTQQLQSIITVPIMIGYMIMFVIARQPEHPLAFFGSIFPLTSPLVMLARIPFGVEWWEIALSLFILAATFILFTWLAARIYRVGILMYGKKATLREIIKWAGRR